MGLLYRVSYGRYRYRKIRAGGVRHYGIRFFISVKGKVKNSQQISLRELG